MGIDVIIILAISYFLNPMQCTELSMPALEHIKRVGIGVGGNVRFVINGMTLVIWLYINMVDVLIIKIVKPDRIIILL